MAKIFVICGHGAGDCGACGNGYEEAERVRALGERIKHFGGDSVILGNAKRNYYRDNGINTLDISKDYQIVELHMDCFNNPNAKGAHVIIKDGFTPDKYDLALANFLTEMFPGRPKKIVKRNDLANPNRAAARGYSYRLLECGFISNGSDIAKFNKNIDAIAKGILECFDINVKEAEKPSSKSFLVKVPIEDLNIRKGPGTDYAKVGAYTGIGTFTIVDVKTGTGSKSGWGKLKSGDGWISLDYVVRL